MLLLSLRRGLMVGWARHNNLPEVPHEKLKLCKCLERFTLWSMLVIIYGVVYKLLGSCNSQIRFLSHPYLSPCYSKVATANALKSWRKT